MKRNHPSKKKIPFEISENLRTYLDKNNRSTALPIQYEDLLRYHISMTLYNSEGVDTLWETVYFEGSELTEINLSLKLIYAYLKTDGDIEALEHLTVDRIDFCLFGNTKPFRVRIKNNMNDNYDHFYVKRADASRVYGLELEHLISPDRIMYLVDGKTLIEEHIAGLPADDFMETQLNNSDFNNIRIAKEFIKFNERCFVRLLGDMRAYNYVVDITPDIEGNQYRMRAIDFDQQSYEGRMNFYLPQYFKENNPVVHLGMKHMNSKTMLQYQLEERSLIALRIMRNTKKVKDFFRVFVKDEISFEPKVAQLKQELANHHKTNKFDHCEKMGEIVLTNLRLLLAKDFKQGMIFTELGQ